MRTKDFFVGVTTTTPPPPLPPSFSVAFVRVISRGTPCSMRESSTRFFLQSAEKKPRVWISCARVYARFYHREDRVPARYEAIRTIRDSRDSDIFTAVRDCEISIAARKLSFSFSTFLFPSRSSRQPAKRSIALFQHRLDNYSFFFILFYFISRLNGEKN